MSLQTYEERAQMYRDAIRKIVEGGAQSVSVLGSTYTFIDIETLERLAEQAEKKYTRSQFGCRTAADLSTPR